MTDKNTSHRRRPSRFIPDSEDELASYASGFLGVAAGDFPGPMDAIFDNSRFKLKQAPNYTTTTDSLQERILLHSGKDEQLKRQQLKLASDHASAVVLRILTGKEVIENTRRMANDSSNHVDDKLTASLFWRMISLFGFEALRLESVTKRVNEELQKCNGKFFIELGRRLNSRSKNKSIPNFNLTIFTMAQFWVSADYPLWMMNNEAGSRFVGYLLGTNVSVDNYAKLIDRHDMIRFKTFPIRATKIHQDGTFMGFEFSRGFTLKV